MAAQSPRMWVAWLAAGAWHLVPSAAWWDNGHMLAAQIARLELRPGDEGVIDEVLSDWERDFPGMSDLVTTAPWADHIKCQTPGPDCVGFLPGLEAFSAWHFRDTAYNPDKMKLSAAQEHPAQNPSAVFALEQAMITFSSSRSRFAYNLMLRFLIHIVADLHQPLHDAQGFFDDDSQFGTLRSGDRGGNLITIRVPGEPLVKNLHSFWDSAGGLYTQWWPLSPEGEAGLLSNATELMKAYPRQTLREYSRNDASACQGVLQGENLTRCTGIFKRWSKEAHDLAVSVAYKNVSSNAQPSAQYISEVQLVSRQQLALAGYRLADLLEVVVADIGVNLGLKPEGWRDEAKIAGEDVGSVLLGFCLVVCCVGCLRKHSLRVQKRKQQRLLESNV